MSAITAVWMVTRTDRDDVEDTISLHATEEGARAGAISAARDNGHQIGGRGGYRWGNKRPKPGATEDPTIFADWREGGDYADVYQIARWEVFP